MNQNKSGIIVHYTCCRNVYKCVTLGSKCRVRPQRRWGHSQNKATRLLSRMRQWSSPAPHVGGGGEGMSSLVHLTPIVKHKANTTVTLDVHKIDHEAHKVIQIRGHITPTRKAWDTPYAPQERHGMHLMSTREARDAPYVHKRGMGGRHLARTKPTDVRITLRKLRSRVQFFQEEINQSLPSGLS